MLLDDCNLQAVVTMPAGVFKPYAGVATAILVFQKGGPTKSVWFYEITADGFSLSDTRTPVEENDIPDILKKWPGREEGLHSFRVSRAELAKYEDVLTPGRYREQQAEAVTHDSPNEIIADVLDLEEKIVLNLRNLQKSLVRK